MNEYFKSLFNLIGGIDMGANFDNMNMDQRRKALSGMFDPMEAGRERLRAMTAPEATSPVAMNPLLAQAMLGGAAGLLSPQQPQFMPIIPQQTMRGVNIPMPSMNTYYGGLL
tara:strand:- start:2632 stop:2967 length:336 start_codon:yes stop_codon:yes gene_type:complete